ncbi:MAG: Esterase EstB [Pseudomonadota bacterium]
MFHLTLRPLAAFALASLLLAATAVTAKDLPTAKPESVGLSSERLARLDQAVHAYVDAGRTPGVVTLVVRHGKLVHLDAYGHADLATGRRTSATDLFRMYSMTKPVTSVALLMLYEEGRFQLTDPLSKYFPAFADVKVYAGTAPGGGLLLDSPRRAITVQDVFRHTAGFSYGFGGASNPVDKAYIDANMLGVGLDDLMQKLAAQPLLYQPGEKWVYSVSHDVQAALVEKLSGMKFDAFVQQRILQPLGMQDSYFRIPPQHKARQPVEYVAGPGGKLLPNPSPLAASYGDVVLGGYSLSTTPQDYARFALMLLNKGQLDGVRLLSPKTVQLMASNHLPPTALANGPAGGLRDGTGYGLGVSVLMDPAQRGNLGSPGEFGWSGAASTHFIVDPQEDLVAVYATQLMMGDFNLRAEWLTLLYQSIVAP